MAKRRFLVMARVGDKSLHAEWLQGEERMFDIYLSYYGASPGRFAADADYWREERGPKWPILHQHLVADATLVSGYDAVWFPDDDLSVDAAGINRMFALFTEHRLALAQPALTPDSYYSHAFLLRDDAYELRYANFIEVMAPLFSPEALRVLGPTFGESPSGWGLDHIWPALLRAVDPLAKVAIIDAASVRHTRPVGGELYRNNPHLSGWADLEKIQALYPQCDLRISPKDKFVVEGVVPSPTPSYLIEVCVCTHNPRPDILSAMILSVAHQDVLPGSLRFTLVNNASDHPISEEVLMPLRLAGIPARILVESEMGILHARLRAIRASSSEWILWIDDDNVLFPDFFRQGLAFISNHPEVGCFGGKLLLPAELNPSGWVRPFLPSLAIRDCGDLTIIAPLGAAGVAEPPGAGAWVKRKVLDEYLELSRAGSGFFSLGRKGKSGLSNCEDTCMMRCAERVGLACAYAPELRLWHLLSPNRFRFKYLMRFMRANGRSHIVLEHVMAKPTRRPGRRSFNGVLKAILRLPKTTLRHSFAYALGRVFFEYGIYEESSLRSRT